MGGLVGVMERRSVVVWPRVVVVGEGFQKVVVVANQHSSQTRSVQELFGCWEGLDDGVGMVASALGVLWRRGAGKSIVGLVVGFGVEL